MLDILAADVVAFADASNTDRLHMFGHNWGAVIDWWVTAQYPDRLDRIVLMGVLHPPMLLAARGITVSHETVRQWDLKFGQGFANQIRHRLPGAGDKRHLDEFVMKIAGVQHWLWRTVDQNGVVADLLLRSRRNKEAANRLLRKLLKR